MKVTNKNFLNHILKTILRYFGIFVVSITLFFCLLLFSMLIPFNMVKDNVLSSIEKINDISNILLPVKEYQKKDIGERIIIEANYLIDEKKPLKSLIEMNYVGSGAFNSENRENITYQEYSRYWCGMVMYARVLFLFTDINGIEIINKFILIILFMFLIKCLINRYKELVCMLIITFIVSSTWVLTSSVQYMAVPIISLISSIILVKMYENNCKNVDIVFFVNGIATAFFDMLTIETVSLTFPLFIYIYLNIKDQKKVLIKDFIKYLFLWGLGYILSFSTKWFIDVLYYGFDYIKFIFSKAMIRVDSFHTNYDNIFQLLFGMINLLYPFCEMKNGYVFLLIIFIFFIYNFLFLVNKKRYLFLILICLVPIIRYTILFSHSELLYGFTFRALIPVVMLVSLVCCMQIINVFKYIKKVIK